MRKIFLLVSCMVTFTINAQVEEFDTTHLTIRGMDGLMGKTTMKAGNHFKLYKDSLVWYPTDKRVLKQLKKQGTPSRVTILLPLQEVETPHGGSYYIYEGKNEKYTIQLFSKPVVKVQTKDDFSGEVSELIYMAL